MADEKKIRLMTMDHVPLFDHAGLVLRRQWSEVDLAELDEAGFAALEKYAGGPQMDAPHRLILVHPLDAAVFASICEGNAAKAAKAAKASKKEQA